MTFFNNIKQILGFSGTEEEEETTVQGPEHSTYINPFKEDGLQKKAPDTTQQEKPQSTAKPDPCAKMNRDIVEKIIGVLNISIPEYVKKYIDNDAQQKYVENLIGTDLDRYASDVKAACEEAARVEWQQERMDMEQKMASCENRFREIAAKNEELKGKVMSGDRQKIALNERIAQLESRTATAEAERDQFQLECKGLMNKLKVAAVNEEEITRLKEENASLTADATTIRSELLRLRQLTAEIDEAALAETAKKISTLTEANETLTLENETLRTKADALTEKEEAVRTLQEEIKRQEQIIQPLKEKEAAYEQLRKDNGDIERMRDELTTRDLNIQEMQRTIQSQNDEIYSLNQRLSEFAGLADLKEEYETISGKNEALKEELAAKTAQIADLSATNREMVEISAQLKETIDSNKRHHSETERLLRNEIEQLKQEKETLQRDAIRKEETIVLTETTPKKSRAPKKSPAKHHISAIDYTTEYTDWLMPSPPSEAIPITPEDVSETPEPTIRQQEPAKKNPNAPSQMELFA